ncbi:MAG TPA: cyclase family protein [Candidatus Polarisedimenticolia bacterium]|nr:cyclase family protein [Candidatus Polarisedimenticolia bacterium]
MRPILSFAAALLASMAATAPAVGDAVSVSPTISTVTKPPVEPGAFRPADLVELVRLDPTIHLDIHYARADNFTGKPVYPEARAFLQRPAAEALVRVHRALRAQGYGLVVFDGYRPWAITKLFWDITPADKKIYVADPALGSKHNRGCAVDLGLYDLKTGKEVVMPSPYDDMTEKAHATYQGGPAEPRRVRDLFIDAMEREGFFVYPYEWWHYDWKDWREYPALDIPFSAIKPMATAVTPDLANAQMIDLTWPFDATTLYWPTSPSGFTLTTLSHGPTPGGWFYAANTFSAPEHGGTHLDAPIHFSEAGRTTEAIPLQQLIAPAIVIDIRKQAAADADYRLQPTDLAEWEARHGRIPAGVIVLLRSGWSDRWPDRARYFGSTTPGDAAHLHFPGYGKEAVDALVNDRKVAALGIDTASIDHGPSTDFIAHQVAMKANVPAFENVAHLGYLPETGAWVAALPMKIAGGSGGPLRIVGFLPGRKESSK